MRGRESWRSIRERRCRQVTRLKSSWSIAFYSTMSFVPGPSASRGGIVVQPTYFTSSLYVDSCREDVEALLQEFSKKYDESPVHSFSLFKSIWISSGWQWMHFKVFDAYARDAFLKVTARLFMGAFSLVTVMV